jgi:hypothetical protein
LQADFAWSFCWKFSSIRSILEKNPGKILQFQMQFATKAEGFGGWTLKKLKYVNRAFKLVTTLAGASGAEQLQHLEIG